MPDGDKVHAHLALIYQKAYMQICEGHYEDEEDKDCWKKRYKRLYNLTKTHRKEPVL
jgi:hypothetical protein